MPVMMSLLDELLPPMEGSWADMVIEEFEEQERSKNEDILQSQMSDPSTFTEQEEPTYDDSSDESSGDSSDDWFYDDDDLSYSSNDVEYVQNAAAVLMYRQKNPQEVAARRRLCSKNSHTTSESTGNQQGAMNDTAACRVKLDHLATTDKDRTVLGKPLDIKYTVVEVRHTDWYPTNIKRPRPSSLRFCQTIIG